MSQQEIDAALDALEEEHNIPGPDDVSDEDLGGEELQAGAEEKDDKNPPGYIDLDTWTNKLGRDPDEWKGKKAYEAEYERIQEIRELKDTLKQVVDTTQTWQQQKETEIREQIEAELAQAREEEDFDAYDKAKEKLDNLPKNTNTEINPVMKEFFTKNPILDRSKPEFSQEFWDDMAMFHDSTIDSLTGGNPQRQQNLTPAQIERSLKISFNKAKELHPEKFRSPRNKRQGQPAPQRRAGSEVPAKSKLSSLKNPRNPRDSSPANDIYEMLAKTDPKAAEKFAKTILGE